MGLKINLDNRTEFVPNLIATSKVQLDCQHPVATSDRLQAAVFTEAMVEVFWATGVRIEPRVRSLSLPVRYSSTLVAGVFATVGSC